MQKLTQKHDSVVVKVQDMVTLPAVVTKVPNHVVVIAASADSKVVRCHFSDAFLSLDS
jgi:hypothetical protein